MIYNDLGDSGVRTSAIGFGAMRWPSEEAAAAILERGMDLGMNYVDTSTGYCGGQSEPWTARAVRDRRADIYFSDKSNWAAAPDAGAVRRSIDKSLETTGLDDLDFYQLWGLQEMDVLTAALKKGGFVEGVRKARDEGLIRHGLGFTFHGTPEVFRAAVDSGEFVCATVSYNLMNRKEEENIAYAAARGVGVIIMNPLAGGVLGMAGSDALSFLRAGELGPAAGALRFLLAHPGVTTALVGFTDVSEVNAAVAALDGAADLDEAFRRSLIERMDAVKLPEGDFCTGCGYCKDCPNGFNPTRFMQAMRDFALYGVAEGRLDHWLRSKYPHADIARELAKCTECGRCAEKCPQHLDIVAEIRRAKAALGVTD